MQLKYQQVEQFLLHQLKNGDFKEGDKFYSEAELKSRFEVSSATVIKAINELVSKGLLVRQQGKGTFVSKARQGQPVKFFDHERYSDANEEVTVVQSIEKESESRILKELQLDHDDHYYHIVRVRNMNGVPVYVQHTYLLAEYFNPKALADHNYYSSIYERIRADSGIDLFNANMEETTKIVFPAPALESQLLQITDQQPAAFIKRHSYLFDNKVIEYVESYKKWDYFEFQIKSF